MNETIARRQLKAMLVELERTREAMSGLPDRGDRSPSRPRADSGDNANAVIQQQEHSETRAVMVAHVAQVKAALARLEAGTWGLCLDCGAKISAARLSARPEAAQCLPCATAHQEHLALDAG